MRDTTQILTILSEFLERLSLPGFDMIRIGGTLAPLTLSNVPASVRLGPFLLHDTPTMILPLGFDKIGLSTKALLDQIRALAMIRDVMRRRIELDAQYIAGLEALAEEYINLESNEVMDGLLKPVLTQLKEEIQCRISANHDIRTFIENLPDITKPEVRLWMEFYFSDRTRFQQDTSTGLTDLMNAKKSYQDVMEAEDVAKSSRSSLEAWYARDPLYNHRIDISRRLPDEDRRYRKSVVAQQTNAEKARLWLSKYPSAINQHQEHIERWWSLLKRASITNSNLVSSLSCHISTCVNQLEAFSPLPAIASVTEAYEEDTGSQISKATVYRNYCIGGVVSDILFGADLFLPESRLETLVSNLGESHFLEFSPWGVAFNIEQRSGGIACYMESLRKSLDTNIKIVTVLELHHYNPLLPLKQDIPPRSPGYSTSRHELAAHQISMNMIPWRYLTVGRPYDYSSVFWGKWDFIGSRPLPAGMKRYYSSKKHKMVVGVQKTGEEYNPSHWEELS
ncbi:hypothetical protein FRC18_003802 [Serendipita sp. 400]|nr:hypothetical protein FRC18_003802 [Serendipita sp. 400]